MLKEIFIKNFILIDELRLEFNNGFNVFLGEMSSFFFGFIVFFIIFIYFINFHFFNL